jgi:hypothetical protein
MIGMAASICQMSCLRAALSAEERLLLIVLPEEQESFCCCCCCCSGLHLLTGAGPACAGALPHHAAREQFR